MMSKKVLLLLPNNYYIQSSINHIINITEIPIWVTFRIILYITYHIDIFPLNKKLSPCSFAKYSIKRLKSHI